MSTYAPAPAETSSGNATTVLVLGIIGLVGGLGSCCCCLFTALAVCAPIAWYLGQRELAAIRAGRAPASGESSAKSGMILGIIGTAILALYLLGIIAYIAMVGVGVGLEALKHGGVPLPR